MPISTRLACGLVIMLFLSWRGQAEESSSWSLQDYLARFPHQQVRLEAFSQRIKAPAIPWQGAADDVRIAMISPGGQLSDYWRRNKKSIRARLDEMAMPYRMDCYFTAAHDPIREQERRLADILVQDPDYLILTLDTRRHQVLIGKLLARGRPKLILQNITTPIKHWQQRQPLLYVGFDHALGTQQLATTLPALFDTQPVHYLMLYGTRGHVSQARGDEFIHLMSTNPNFHLRQRAYTNLDPERTRALVLQALSDIPELNLIYASTTDIALSSIQALEQAGRNKDVMVNGWGGGLDELEALSRNRLDLTVMRMNDDSGVAIAEAIRLDREGNSGSIPHVYSGAFAVITQDTPEAELERLKAYAFRYSR